MIVWSNAPPYVVNATLSALRGRISGLQLVVQTPLIHLTGEFPEEWFKEFYGDSYYTVFEPDGRAVGMAEHKGRRTRQRTACTPACRGAARADARRLRCRSHCSAVSPGRKGLHMFLVRDVAPQYELRSTPQSPPQPVSVHLFDLKSALRGVAGGFLVHVTHTRCVESCQVSLCSVTQLRCRAEGERDVGKLLGLLAWPQYLPLLRHVVAGAPALWNPSLGCALWPMTAHAVADALLPVTVRLAQAGCIKCMFNPTSLLYDKTVRFKGPCSAVEGWELTNARSLLATSAG